MQGPIPQPPKERRNPLDTLKALTQAEVKELTPRFEKALKSFFKLMDTGITYSNRNMRDAYIWRSIDNEEIHEIAVSLIDLGTRSKMVAETVRRVTAAERMFTIGAITGPRFIMTVQHYLENGGFMIPTPGRLKQYHERKAQAQAVNVTPQAASVPAAGGQTK